MNRGISALGNINYYALLSFISSCVLTVLIKLRGHQPPYAQWSLFRTDALVP